LRLHTRTRTNISNNNIYCREEIALVVMKKRITVNEGFAKIRFLERRIERGRTQLHKTDKEATAALCYGSMKISRFSLPPWKSRQNGKLDLKTLTGVSFNNRARLRYNKVTAITSVRSHRLRLAGTPSALRSNKRSYDQRVVLIR
jgi:hypothetical protein